MNKIKQWDVQFPYSEYPKWYRMCDSADVADLEARYAELVEAAKDIISRWDSRLWIYDEHTGVSIDRLRKAINELEVMP